MDSSTSPIFSKTPTSMTLIAGTADEPVAKPDQDAVPKPPGNPPPAEKTPAAPAFRTAACDPAGPGGAACEENDRRPLLPNRAPRHRPPRHRPPRHRPAAPSTAAPPANPSPPPAPQLRFPAHPRPFPSFPGNRWPNTPRFPEPPPAAEPESAPEGRRSDRTCRRGRTPTPRSRPAARSEPAAAEEEAVQSEPAAADEPTAATGSESPSLKGGRGQKALQTSHRRKRRGGVPLRQPREKRRPRDAAAVVQADGETATAEVGEPAIQAEEATAEAATADVGETTAEAAPTAADTEPAPEASSEAASDTVTMPAEPEAATRETPPNPAHARVGGPGNRARKLPGKRRAMAPPEADAAGETESGGGTGSRGSPGPAAEAAAGESRRRCRHNRR